MATKDTPGVLAPPPLIFLAFLGIGFVLDFAWPLPLRPPGLDHRLTWPAGAMLISIGIAALALGVRNFIRGGTPVPTREPVRALITTGIHGRTRNPIYVGMFLIYLGLGLVANTAWIFLLLVPLALIIRYGVVAREETYLEKKFGEPYRGYKARVRRWL